MRGEFSDQPMHSCVLLPSVGALLALITLGTSVPAHAQQTVHHQVKSTVGTDLQVVTVVDGAANPESIPDDVAYLHFFRVLSKNPNSRDQALEERRRRAYLHYSFPTRCTRQGSSAGPLSELQIDKLLQAIDRLIPELEAASAAASQSGAGLDDSNRANLQRVAAAASGLSDSVDPDASAKIALHIREHMKSHIQLVQAQVPYPVH